MEREREREMAIESGENRERLTEKPVGLASNDVRYLAALSSVAQS